MKYASGGDLHKYLQKNFTNITWNKQKLYILHDISMGYVYFIFINYILKFRLLIFYIFRLEIIHNKKFMHRDFHSDYVKHSGLSDFIT
jgi:hypothetical protein